jgi:hypothetical protein
MTKEDQIRLANEAEMFLNSFLWQTWKGEREAATLYALSECRDNQEDLENISKRWGALQDMEDDLMFYIQSKPDETV